MNPCQSVSRTAMCKRVRGKHENSSPRGTLKYLRQGLSMHAHLWAPRWSIRNWGRWHCRCCCMWHLTRCKYWPPGDRPIQKWMSAAGRCRNWGWSAECTVVLTDPLSNLQAAMHAMASGWRCECMYAVYCCSSQLLCVAWDSQSIFRGDQLAVHCQCRKGVTCLSKDPVGQAWKPMRHTWNGSDELPSRHSDLGDADPDVRQHHQRHQPPFQ